MLKTVVAIYDRAMQGMEDAGLGTWRRDLLAPLEGTVLEIGAGTGSNLPFFPPAVTSLVLAEPDRHMRARLLAATGVSDRPVEVISAPAERLPFPDGSFDAVVSALVLCSVGDQALVLEEIRRVLRPDGRFVFIEHVAAKGSPRQLRQQRWIEPVWKRLAGNCHLTRSTEEAIERAGFAFETLERQGLPKAPPMVRPSIRGTAGVAANRSRADT
jgi:ubiquinone/menaquinone biosynthesis C-methylase UbiE